MRKKLKNIDMKPLLEQYFAIVKRFVPEPPLKTSVGLDIGSESCRLVELERKKANSYSLINWKIVPIENNDLSGAVRKATKGISAPVFSLASAVFGKGTLIRFIDMPRMGLEELRKSFAFEADKYFPFSKEDIYMDSFILNSAAKSSTMSVLAAAAKKELIDERIKLLTDIGLQADNTTLNSVAITNAIEAFGYEDVLSSSSDSGSGIKGSKAVAILDIGQSLSNVTVCVDNVPSLIRDIFVGGKDFSKAVSMALNLDFAGAEQWKCNAANDPQEILKSCDSAIADLVSELRLSFDYFVTEKNIQIAQVLLTGGGSALPGLADALFNYLEIPVGKWNPFAALDLAEAVSKEELASNAERLTVALGLALCQ